MFFPFRPNLGFGPTNTKQNVLAVAIIVTIWICGLLAIYNGIEKKDATPQQNIETERTPL